MYAYVNLGKANAPCPKYPPKPNPAPTHTKYQYYKNGHGKMIGSMSRRETVAWAAAYTFDIGQWRDWISARPQSVHQWFHYTCTGKISKTRWAGYQYNNDDTFLSIPPQTKKHNEYIKRYPWFRVTQPWHYPIKKRIGHTIIYDMEQMTIEL